MFNITSNEWGKLFMLCINSLSLCNTHTDIYYVAFSAGQGLMTRITWVLCKAAVRVSAGPRSPVGA